MNWFTSIFSSSKTVDNVLDKDNGLLSQVGGWIGNMNFTPEEKAKMNARLADGVSDFVKMTLGENTERSKARRSVAKMWIRAQLLMIFIVVITAPFDMEMAKFYLSIAFGTVMVGGTFSIIGFFFGAHMLSSHMAFGKKKDKD